MPPEPAPGRARLMRVEHEYDRGGALAYLAAYDVHRARVMGRCEPTTGIVPFGRLVEQVMTIEPYASAERVFWIVDNGSSHRGQAAVDRFQGEWPTLRLIHLPVHASWLDQCEIFFSIVERKVVTPNDFTDLDQIAERLAAFETATTPWPNPSTGPSAATISTSSSPASTPTPPEPPEPIDSRLPSTVWRSPTARAVLWPSVSTAPPAAMAGLTRPPDALSAPTSPTSPARRRRRRARPVFASATSAPPHDWGFAIYLASKDGYEDSILPSRHASPAPPQRPSTAPAVSTSTTSPCGQTPATRFTRTLLTRTTKWASESGLRSCGRECRHGRAAMRRGGLCVMAPAVGPRGRRPQREGRGPCAIRAPLRGSFALACIRLAHGERLRREGKRQGTSRARLGVGELTDRAPRS